MSVLCLWIWWKDERTRCIIYFFSTTVPWIPFLLLALRFCFYCLLPQERCEDIHGKPRIRKRACIYEPTEIIVIPFSVIIKRPNQINRELVEGGTCKVPPPLFSRNLNKLDIYLSIRVHFSLSGVFCFYLLGHGLERHHHQTPFSLFLFFLLLKNICTVYRTFLGRKLEISCIV